MRAVIALAVVLSASACGGTLAMRRLSTPRPRGDVELVSQIAPRTIRWTVADVTDDGRRAVLGDNSGVVWVWDVAQRKILARWDAHASGVMEIDVTAGGTTWSVGYDGSICRFQLGTLAVEQCYRVPITVLRAAISPDGRRAALVAPDEIVLLDLAGEQVAARLPSPSTETSVAFSLDAQTLAVGHAESTVVQLRDARTGAALSPLDTGCKVMALAFDQRGLAVLTFGADDIALEACLVDPATAQVRRLDERARESDRALTARLGATAYADSTDPLDAGTAVGGATADGRFAVLARSNTGEIIVFDLVAGTKAESRIWTGGVRTAAFTSDHTLRLGTAHGLLALDLASGAVRYDILAADASSPWLYSVTALSGDGDFAITADGTLWWAGGRRPVALRSVRPHMESPLDHRRFACALDGPGCKLFHGAASFEDAATGDGARALPPAGVDPIAERSDVAVSADARRLADLARSRTSIDLYNTTNDTRIGTVVTRRDIVGFTLSDDGKRLAVVEGDLEFGPVAYRAHVFDVDTGREIATMDVGARRLGVLAFAPDGTLVAGEQWCHRSGGDGMCDVVVLDVARRETRKLLRGHRHPVEVLAVSPGGGHVVSVGADGTARVWRLETCRTAEAACSLAVAVGAGEWILYGDDGVFDASRRGGALVAAVSRGRAFALDQFAAHNNRLDVLLTRMGRARDDVIRYFRGRHEARLRGLGLRDADLSALVDAPEAVITGLVERGTTAEITAEITSPAADLARYQVWVNRVPVLAKPGEARGRSFRFTTSIELGPGLNRIEVSAWTRDGVEALRTTRDVDGGERTGRIFFVGLGISEYRDPRWNVPGKTKLSYPDDDATALAALFASRSDAPRFAPLVDRDVTRGALARIRAYLAQATVDDTVIVFLSGHGVLAPDAGAEFLFPFHDFDDASPLKTAIPFTELEELFVGLPARRRLLLVDACVSGERDDVADPSAPAPAGLVPKTIELVRAGDAAAQVGAGDAAAGLLAVPPEYLFDRDRYAFEDLQRDTGVVALGSSRWDELSFESPDWRHGAFTAALGRALGDAASDADLDGRISLDELRAVVERSVADLTSDRQHPTLKRANVDAAISFPPP